MQCLRCGRCCVDYDVMIIKPEFINEFSIENPQDHMIMHKPHGMKCPHLSLEGEEAICSVHHFPWFESTPCYEFTQIGHPHDPCRIGVGVRTNKIQPAKNLIRSEYEG